MIDLVQPKSIGVKESNEQPVPADEEESNLINALENRIRREQAAEEEETKKPTVEGYGTWLRNKYVNSSS